MEDNLRTPFRRNSENVSLRLDRPKIAPLVGRVIPSIRRNVGSGIKQGDFLSQPIVKQYPNKESSVITTMENDKKLIISGYEGFFDLVKSLKDLPKEPEIDGFISTMNTAMNGCPCSRGPVKQAAKNIYAQSLPLLQARNSEIFNYIKANKGVSFLVFKEGDLFLLEI